MRLPDRLEGAGLLLRVWTVEDAEALGGAVAESVEHLRPWMPWAAAEPTPVEERRERIAGWRREWEAGGDAYMGFFVDGQVAGGGGWHHRIGPGGLEIGYWVHPGFLRQGIATRAARLLTEAGLAAPGITRVEIHHDKANLASGGVPRKLGYRLLGEAPRPPEAPAEIGIERRWRFPPDAGAIPPDA